MRRFKHSWTTTLVAAVFLASWWGCQPSPPVVETGEEPATAEKAPPEGKTEAPAAEEETVAPVVEPPPPPTIPKVTLSETSAATCLVKVDDMMPEGRLPDLEGNSQELRELRGEKLTVVYFWTADNPYALAGLSDLATDVVTPYADKGVKVIAINEDKDPEAAKKHVQELKAEFVHLHDPEGKYFAQVATEELPRVYLLDAEGKILWFDLEYSRSVRRNLLQAVQVALGET